MLGVAEQRTFVTTGQSATSTGKEYLPTPGGVLTIRDSSGGLDDDATDLLGTPVANLNLASGVLGESLATPYGQNRYTANLSGPGGMQTAKGFTGQYQDTSMAGSSGLDYFNARYYDPAIGRFSSADTAQPGLGDPLGLDTYAYARGMVESATDPSGHSCMAMRSDGEGCDGGGEGFFGYPPNAGEGKSIGGGYDPALQLVLRFLQALKHLHDLMALGRLTDGWGEAADPLIGRSRNGDRFAAEAQAEAQDGIGAAHDPLMRSRDGDQGPGCHCAPRLSSTTGQPSAQPAQVEGSPDVTYHPVNDDPCRDGSTLIRTQCVSWQTAFSDLAQRRAAQGLPAARSPEDVSTFARLDIESQTFYGQNGKSQEITLRVNATSRYHAETNAFQAAYNAGIRGGHAILYVDRPLCKACGLRGMVKSLGLQLGLDSLVVYTPDGMQILFGSP